uniref:MARVEL domain-containing protein n=1 Tax=Acrobeloides nanus TaxID=290746 RepID=A0A914ED91_9BILA
MLNMEMDASFPKGWPYGSLMTIQWAGSLALIITLYVGSYWLGGTGFVIFSGWTSFFSILFIWLAHLFGLQRKTYQVGHGFVFIPFSLIAFFYSIIGILLFAISFLICFVSTFYSFRYAISVTFTYLISTIFCIMVGGSFAYFAILLYRACPNGNLRNLTQVIIEGDRTAAMTPNINDSTNPNRPPI